MSDRFYHELCFNRISHLSIYNISQVFILNCIPYLGCFMAILDKNLMKAKFNLPPPGIRRLLLVIGVVLWISLFVWTISVRKEFLVVIVMPTFFTLLYGILAAVGLWIYDVFSKE